VENVTICHLSNLNVLLLMSRLVIVSSVLSGPSKLENVPIFVLQDKPSIKWMLRLWDVLLLVRKSDLSLC
jgi:hypothetical protein